MAEALKNTNLFISTDKTRLDFEVLNKFLLSAYWSKNRTKEQIKTAVANSVFFGVYLKNEQIGFARVLSDNVTVAFLFDVFILDKFRGQGYGKDLIKYVLNYHDFRDVKKWMLATQDAHKLYEKSGFKHLKNPENLMEMFPSKKL